MNFELKIRQDIRYPAGLVSGAFLNLTVTVQKYYLETGKEATVASKLWKVFPLRSCHDISNAAMNYK
jgi:hypothetical protein